MQEFANQPNQRSYRARAGIVTLNLITPGLGLIRVGDYRTGFLFIFSPFIVIAFMTLGMGHIPITSYGRAVLALILILTVIALLYLVSMWLTWHKSRSGMSSGILSRWYVLTGIVTFIMVMSQFTRIATQYFYKAFYLPSDSMTPTLDRGDKLIADMRWRGPVKRGNIILFDAVDGVRISRVAAIAGDRIAMREGVPVINGSIVTQFVHRKTMPSAPNGSSPARLVFEKLPGEPSVHEVLDEGSFQWDDTEEVIVPTNHIYVLGDNRDRSADSRVPTDLKGVGMVSLTAIRGKPLYIHWSSNHAKIGTRLNP